mgnify:CR=1 FL=1
MKDSNLISKLSVHFLQMYNTSTSYTEYRALTGHMIQKSVQQNLTIAWVQQPSFTCYPDYGRIDIWLSLKFVINNWYISTLITWVYHRQGFLFNKTVKALQKSLYFTHI